MSTTIDKRIVEMKFDKEHFEKGVSSTIKALDTLKSKLNFSGAKKSLSDLNAAGKGVSLEHIGKGVDTLAHRFTNLGIVGGAALATITHKAINMATALAQSAPISDGLSDYHEKLTSVQTIMNATGASIQVVDAHFKSLDTYADKTIYNLKDMTGAFAKFTNAGVEMDKSVPAIKGIANMVALAGQGAEAASIAMYNLSQSIAGGFLTTTDYRSLNLANVATKEWKEQMIQGALAAGKLKKGTNGIYTIPGAKGAYTDAQLFSEALSEGWASADVLMKVLGDYGDETTAIGKKALAAAQNVKSLPMMFETLRAGLGTQWTDTFEILLGNVTEATKTFSELTDTIGKIIYASGEARNKLLGDWKKMHGREILIYAIKNAFEALRRIIVPIKDAFREVFPPTTAKSLVQFTTTLRHVTGRMKIGKETAENLKRTFKGVFSVFKIGIEIVKGIARLFFSLFSIAGTGTGGFLALTASVGDFITKIQEWLTTSGAIKSFFDTLISAKDNVIQPLVQFFARLAEALGDLLSGDVSGFMERLGDAFSGLGDVVVGFTTHLGNMAGKFGFISKKVAEFLGGLGSTALQPLIDLANILGDAFQTLYEHLTFKMELGGLFSNLDTASAKLSGVSVVGEKVGSVWDGVVKAFSAMSGALSPITSGLAEFFAVLVEKLTEFIKGMDFQDAVALLNTGFFIAMYIALRRFIKSMEGVFSSLSGLIDNISDVFGTLTDTLKTMQRNVRANIILKIAIAVALLAASVYTLASLDPKRLGIALAGLAVLFLMMNRTIKSFEDLDFRDTGVVKAGTALVLLAFAVNLLATAVEKMSKLDWQEMIKGLVGVGGLLAGLILFTKFSTADSAGVKAGAGLILLAVAVRILAGALETIGSMPIKDIIKGIVAMQLMIGMLAAMLVVMNAVTGIPQAALGLLILAAALSALSVVMRIYAAMDVGTFAKGLLTMAIALTAIALALRLMPKGMVAKSAGLVIVAGALLVLSGVLKIFGSMSIKAIAKSLVVLAASLAILVIAMHAATGALAGAAAIFVIASALAVLAPVLMLLGQMSWESITKGFVALAAVMLVLIVSMYALTPVIAVLALFAASIKMLGLAMLLAGAGFALFAGGLAALAVSGAAGFAVLIAGFTAFMSMIPQFVHQFGLGLLAAVVVIREVGPKMVRAFGVVVLAILEEAIKLIPKLIEVATLFVIKMIEAIVKIQSKLWDAGLKLLLGFLTAIDNNVYRIVNVAIRIVRKFMRAISDQALPLADSAFKMIIAFINAIAEAIEENMPELHKAGGRLAFAIVDGMTLGLAGAAVDVAKAGADLGKKAWEGATGWLDSHSPSRKFMEVGKWSSQGFAIGLTKYSDLVSTASAGVGEEAMRALRESISGMSEIVDGDVDIRPVITPVLDLSEMRKDARQMGSMLSAAPISVDAAYLTARDVSAGYRSNQADKIDLGAAPTTESSEITFIQNNYSPKALSSADLYRQTKNQLSVVKDLPTVKGAVR